MNLYKIEVNNKLCFEKYSAEFSKNFFEKTLYISNFKNKDNNIFEFKHDSKIEESLNIVATYLLSNYISDSLKHIDNKETLFKYLFFKYTNNIEFMKTIQLELLVYFSNNEILKESLFRMYNIKYLLKYIKEDIDSSLLEIKEVFNQSMKIPENILNAEYDVLVDISRFNIVPVIDDLDCSIELDSYLYNLEFYNSNNNIFQLSEKLKLLVLLNPSKVNIKFSDGYIKEYHFKNELFYYFINCDIEFYSISLFE